MLVECRAHSLEMRRRGAAAAADDARTGIDRQPGVVGHQLGRAGIVDVLAEHLRDAALALAMKAIPGLASVICTRA